MPHSAAADWITGRWFTASGALVAETVPGLDAKTVFAHLSGRRHVLFLESATAATAGDQADPQVALGRYSFVAADPVHSEVVHTEGTAPEHGPPTPRNGGLDRLALASARLRLMLEELATPTIPGLPPFQGGIAGLWSYECGLSLLGIAPSHPGSGASVVGPVAAPLLSLHLYDVVFAFDHALGRGWFISQGVPASSGQRRRDRAADRLHRLLATGNGPSTAGGTSAATPRPRGLQPLPRYPAVCSTHTATDYRHMVAAGIEAVRAGDVFQVNLAQQFLVEAVVDPVLLHARARSLNPAPFAAFFDAGAATIVSMSPERFLQVSRGTVRMHPIKGTRRILASPEADLYAGADLAASDKDRAENVMIVDLVRNDLARVCEPASVRVEALCRLERYRHVQHLVSVVAGRLRRDLGALDAFAVASPAGSVTGAPKHRACEIIASLEPIPRGPYCGSLGYVGLDGTADFNLLIRTFVVGSGRIAFAAGGGITAASDPEAEHAESMHKAEGLLRVLESLGLTTPQGGP